MSVIAAPVPQPPSITAAMADRYGMRPDAFEATLRATVFPSTGSREELAAFLMVAKEYELNPITREIYAFPKKGGGIQPIVGIDGWANIINSHPAFDGMDFIDREEKGMVVAITCRIYRKDRSHPISATEYLNECFRQVETWQKWPRRMLRHKALIQAARYAFGFAGLVDPDEAERFTERQSAAPPPAPPTSMKQLADRLTSLAQPRPPEPVPAPPQPRPPQPGGDDEDWPPPEEPEEDDGKDQNGAMGYDTLEEKRIDQAPPDDEDARLQEAGREKALQGSKKLRFWRARLRPEQEARIDWVPLEAAAKAADAPAREGA